MGEVLVTVGQAAREAGVSAKAIRVWEAKGLLTTAGRTKAGYRLFTSDDLATLRFIRQAKLLGLRLDEISEVLNLRRAGRAPCEHVIGLLDRRIADIDHTISELRQLRIGLSSTRDRPAETAPPTAGVCPIIEDAPVGSTG